MTAENDFRQALREQLRATKMMPHGTFEYSARGWAPFELESTQSRSWVPERPTTDVVTPGGTMRAWDFSSQSLNLHIRDYDGSPDGAPFPLPYTGPLPDALEFVNEFSLTPRGSAQPATVAVRLIAQPRPSGRYGGNPQGIDAVGTLIPAFGTYGESRSRVLIAAPDNQDKVYLVDRSNEDAGGFSPGDTVTGDTSGATGVVETFYPYPGRPGADRESQVLLVNTVTGTFDYGEAVTGPSSTGTFATSANIGVEYPGNVEVRFQVNRFTNPYNQPALNVNILNWSESFGVAQLYWNHSESDEFVLWAPSSTTWINYWEFSRNIA